MTAPNAEARPLAIITDSADLDRQPAIDILNAAGFDTHLLAWDREAVIPETAQHAVAALAGYAHVGADFFEQLPDLRWLGTASTGTDMVDLEAAAAAAVTVRPLPGPSTEEVAAHGLALLLAVERDIVRLAARTAAGEWSRPATAPPRRLSELTLGLYGLGRIGTQLAALARPLVGRVVAHDPYVTSSTAVDALLTPDELLQQSDILSLHVPLTADTRGLIDAEALAQLPIGATVINVSRGELVDSAALLAALDSGRMRGAGLDVLDGEPPAADHPLRRHPLTIVTPHVAYLSDASLRAYEEDPARALVEWWRSASRPASTA